jgi:hypothetical protein
MQGSMDSVTNPQRAKDDSQLLHTFNNLLANLLISAQLGNEDQAHAYAAELIAAYRAALLALDRAYDARDRVARVWDRAGSSGV